MKSSKYLKIFFFYFFILFLFITSSFSVSISILGEINENQKTYLESLNISLSCGENYTIIIPNGAKNVYVKNTLIYYKKIIVLDCKKPTIISYNLNNVEFLSNGLQRIERNFLKYKGINFTYSLIIPIEFLIIKKDTIPNKFKITLLKNNYKLIKFEKNDFYLIYIEKLKESLNLSISKFIKEFSEIIVKILMFFSFLLGIFLTFIYFSKFKKKEDLVVPSFVLSNEELLILKIIKENKGINQKQIGIKINFSKSKVSMIINELEKKKLIKREKFGRSYKVYIDKKII